MILIALFHSLWELLISAKRHHECLCRKRKESKGIGNQEATHTNKRQETSCVMQYEEVSSVSHLLVPDVDQGDAYQGTTMTTLGLLK